MPRPLKNPLKRDREREVAVSLYEGVFPGSDPKVPYGKAYFYVKVGEHHYKVEVKEVQQPQNEDADS